MVSEDRGQGGSLTLAGSWALTEQIREEQGRELTGHPQERARVFSG